MPSQKGKTESVVYVFGFCTTEIKGVLPSGKYSSVEVMFHVYETYSPLISFVNMFFTSVCRLI